MVTTDDVVKRFPRPLMPEELQRVAVYIDDAVALLEAEFERRGTTLDDWTGGSHSRAKRVDLVIIDMVSAPILVGVSRGLRQANSSTGGQSDGATWYSPGDIGWGGVKLTPQNLEDLGLTAGSLPRWLFPSATYPAEVMPRVRTYRDHWAY